jgi:uncharacterized protein DUF4159
MGRRASRFAVAIGVGLFFAAAVGYAQFGRLPVATRESFDGAFQFCRLAFRGVQGGDGGGWLTDYPDADLNVSTRLGELTKTPISKDPRTGDPNHVIVQLTDPMLFRCPIVMGFEVGNFYIDDREAKILRDYLEKGGFFWVDDFWGTYAWSVWENQIRKAFPSGQFPIKDLSLDHALFHQVFQVTKIAQIPSINHWLSYRDTSERFADSRPAHIRGISDEHGRLMLLMTHNTDFGDSWEREGVSHDYFLNFSVDGYAFGVNAFVYAMTH